MNRPFEAGIGAPVPLRLLGALFVAAAIACGESTSTDPLDHRVSVPSTPLIPLDVGTHWTYDRIDSIEFTTDTLLRSFRTTRAFSVIADTVDVQRQPWAVLDSSNDILPGPIAGHSYLANRADGAYELFPLPNTSPSTTFVFSILEFSYPTIAGSAYLGTRVLSTDSVVTVPAGTFHCFVYAQLDERSFLAPGVGLVMKSLTPIQGFADGKLISQDQVFYMLRSMSKP